MDSISEKNYLSSIEAISNSASRCCLDFSRMSDAGAEIADLSAFLEISSVQVIFFSCMAELSFQKSVTMDFLSKHLKCGAFKLLTFIGDFEALEKRGYIQKMYRNRGRKHSYNDVAYTVPHHVIEALRKCDISLISESAKYDLPGFLKQISSLVEERQQNSVSTSQVLSEVQFLTSLNLELPYVSYVNEGLKDWVSKCTIFAFSYQRLKGVSTIGIDTYANALFDDLSEQLDFSQMVCSGHHELVASGFIKLVTSEFDGDKMGAITSDVMKILYNDYPALLIMDSKIEGLIKSSSIVAKDLFFSNGINDQIALLESAMAPGMFKNYTAELRKNGLAAGITSMFYGAPGTGKTEAVYQIARKTGRNIMMVDLSQTKSKWFGESEKQVKKIFDDYAALTRNSEIEPILFVNEADGFFTKRIEMPNGGSHSADQSINTMQNILLQSLENFEGILIATTNLTGNLDKAFERRFTFRIDFPRPDSKVRMHIWKSKIPGLTDDEAASLADKFDMTGGEIDVQVRQILLKKVLDKKVNLFTAALECCNKDHGFSSRRKIGF